VIKYGCGRRKGCECSLNALTPHKEKFPTTHET
jgi:hypothetical protein